MHARPSNRRSAVSGIALFILLVFRPCTGAAQDSVPGETAGTGSTEAFELQMGAWRLMIHGRGFLTGTTQSGRRGEDGVGLQNWAMVGAIHPVGRGSLALRGMFSAEPWTLPRSGYPELLQNGETYHRLPIHDRQHPHDLFMEISARAELPLVSGLAVSLYAAPVGEPATGPTAFMHRASAEYLPLTPLGHHWQDASHVAFGVLTAGLTTQAVGVEASIFNGREPDENRTNFDFRGRRLDSWAVRASARPWNGWSWSMSYGYFKSPEQVLLGTAPSRLSARGTSRIPAPRFHLIFTPTFPDQPLPRTTLKRTTVALARETRAFAATAVYAVQRHAYEVHRTQSALVEMTLRRGHGTAVFGRAEWVEKSDFDLVVDSLRPPRKGFIRFGDPPPPPPPPLVLSVASLTLGAFRSIREGHAGNVGVGLQGTADLLPARLVSAYGTRVPVGVALFVRVAPPLSRTRGMDGMRGMGPMAASGQASGPEAPAR